MIHPAYIALVLFLWSLPLLAVLGPRLASAASAAWRDPRPEVWLILMLALSAMFFAFPSSADKGGGGGETNAPAAAAAGRINLYHVEDGKLVPLGVEIKRMP